MAYKDLGDKSVLEILKKVKTIAVVGLSDNPEKTSYQVADITQQAGYTIVPVNPLKVGKTILGETVYGSLTDIPFQVDMVNVFRPSPALLGVAEEMLKTDIPIFWAQLGLINDDAAALLYANNRDQVVMDRCIKIELAKI